MLARTEPNSKLPDLDEYLRVMYGDDWESVHVAAFEGDPKTAASRQWAGGQVRRLNGKLHEPGLNLYACGSLFKKASRRKEHFDKCHCIMVDDVGTKTNKPSIKPTAMIETSKGNFQWWYKLDPPCTDRVKVEGTIKQLIKSGLCSGGTDPGMAGVTRYGRLPAGINGKPAAGDFAVHLHAFDPEATYSIDDLRAGFELPKLNAVEPPKPPRAGNGKRNTSGVMLHMDSILPSGTVADLERLVDALPKKVAQADSGDWFKYAGAVWLWAMAQPEFAEDLYRTLDEWLKLRSGYDKEANRRRWNNGFEYTGARLYTIRSLAKEAHRHAPDKITTADLARWELRDKPKATADEDDEYSDEDYKLLASLPDLPDEAMPGILRDMVDAATEKTEATRAGVAVTILTHFAARYGQALCLQIGDKKRTLVFNSLLIGPTGRGRKGTSSEFAERLFPELEDFIGLDGMELVDQRFEQLHTIKLPSLQFLTGVSSGQGIIERVRDGSTFIDRSGKPCHVAGVDDKRLLLTLSEFGQVFIVARQDGNTLSIVLRDSFDGRRLQNPSRTNPIYSTDPHICVAGHITMAEYKNNTIGDKRNTDLSNGLLNRFVPVFSQRKKLVPVPKPVDDDTLQDFVMRLASNLLQVFQGHVLKLDSRRIVEIKLSPAAEKLWDQMYRSITMEQYGSECVDNHMARIELHVLVIAALLAAINGKRTITTRYLRAARLWGEHMVRTTTTVFTTLKQRREAEAMRQQIEKIRGALIAAGGQMSLRDLQRKFGNSKFNAKAIDATVRAMITSSPAMLEVLDDKCLRLIEN